MGGWGKKCFIFSIAMGHADNLDLLFLLMNPMLTSFSSLNPC